MYGRETPLASLKPKLQSEVRKAKHSHPQKVKQSFDACDRGSLKKLKSMLELKGQDKECNLDPDTLNDVYIPFEHEFTPPEISPILSLSMLKRLLLPQGD